MALPITLLSCGGSSERSYNPDDYSQQEQEQVVTESLCPYCNGYGTVTTMNGPAYCSYCQGKGKRYNVSFSSKGTLKRSDKDCPTKPTTFECVDEHNNGIISSTDRCIHCTHTYNVHR